MTLLALLFQFLCRLSFGLAVTMLYLSRAQITSGFFRNHLYVLLGFNVLASLIAYRLPGYDAPWLSVVAAVASYIGSVAWLYEKKWAGFIALTMVIGFSMTPALVQGGAMGPHGTIDVWKIVDVVTSAILLGTTLGAMFLGHWYLNSPSMKIEPLRSLVREMAIGLVLRIAVAAVGLARAWSQETPFDTLSWVLLAIRWLPGLAAMGVIIWMTWQTLKIPNTQSATGILYVGVILTFLGELAGMLLSSQLGLPV